MPDKIIEIKNKREFYEFTVEWLNRHDKNIRTLRAMIQILADEAGIKFDGDDIVVN